ncbi:putative leucine-rich repeat receptor-like protein kinase [Dorcoceras hygrometricum]|uniref:Putative leucine-rich repeat receptor-like protein kinase n=1 Tax=Dorcoceras hygrometricum TaxID=472368 RepID=A0A2Z7BLK7_9LAMI|nr:putative leucine-rich repeat receptor-like protein kinase [Dorcoceras hygrometricum]
MSFSDSNVVSGMTCPTEQAVLANVHRSLFPSIVGGRQLRRTRDGSAGLLLLRLFVLCLFRRLWRAGRGSQEKLPLCSLLAFEQICFYRSGSLLGYHDFSAGCGVYPAGNAPTEYLKQLISESEQEEVHWLMTDDNYEYYLSLVTSDLATVLFLGIVQATFTIDSFRKQLVQHDIIGFNGFDDVSRSRHHDVIIIISYNAPNRYDDISSTKVCKWKDLMTSSSAETCKLLNLVYRDKSLDNKELFIHLPQEEICR